MRKYISLLLAVVVACGLFSGCSAGDENSEVTEAVSILSEESLLETESAYGNSFFDESYDPFAEDYDPYGGSVNNADSPSISAKVSEETTRVSETMQAAGTDDLSHTTAVQADKSQNESSDEILFTINISGSWNDGQNDFVQLDGTVKNNGTTTVSGWIATINVGKSDSVDQSWNCEYTFLDDGKISVEPVDYNSKIDAGSEATFGLIIKNPGNIDTSDASVTYNSTTSTASENVDSGNSSSSVGNSNPEIVQAKDVPEPTTDDWLYVEGNKIVDKDGKEVWLTGVSWFGYNTGTNTFDGLWSCDLNSSIAAIADRGFNLLRVPISTELIKQWSNGEYPTANFNQATNSYLVGMNSLEIFDYVVGQCRANGLKIMIDIHCAETDSMGHMKNLWADGNISEKDYLDALNWIANRYKDDDTIIAYDLENEPHGKASESPRAKWDSSDDSDNWRYIAEKAAQSVFKANPDVLVMVEGIEIYPIDTNGNGDFSSTNMGDYYCTWWGGNLRGVKDNPVNLGEYQNKLVYSPHDYGPSVYQQPWFENGYTFDSLYNDCWYDNWFYIQDEGIAPLLIGEWGGFMTEPNLTWMTYLRRLIKENRINHTFWCFNSNSGDTGGLVKDDFTSWDEEKYSFVKEVLWQQDGKFVGLDHEIPLGSNGITLSEVK